MERDEVIKALEKLRAPFLEHQISKLPKPTKAQTDEVKQDYKKGIRCDLCGTWHHPKAVHLDYVGHAALTDRLLDVDPLWSWEPLSKDPNGLPLLDKDGGMWIRLTICGVTRLGYGDAEGKAGGNAVKERIGDALRNAAMRFGAALDLWHKGDLHPDEPEDTKPKDTKPKDTFKPESSDTKWAIDELEEFETTMERADAAFKLAGVPRDAKGGYNEFRAKWKENKRVDPAEKVLTALAAFVKKMEAAAKAKAESLKATA